MQLQSFPCTFSARPSALQGSVACSSTLFSNTGSSLYPRFIVSASLGSTLAERASSGLKRLCKGLVPDQILSRLEEVGYTEPTQVQNEALPVILSGRDCVIQAQTGSGKTLAYLLLVFSVIDSNRSAVQALIVVPTRELGIQVTKVSRKLAAKSSDVETEQKTSTVMALLDGGTLKRHKSWLKVEPPAVIIATLRSLCQMLDKQTLKLDALKVLVIDEVDFMFNSSKEVSSLKKLLTNYSSINNRQTIFVSASIPQHRRFVYDCIQQKWTKADVVHVHVNSIQPLPSCLYHRFVICSSKMERYSALLHLVRGDKPQSAIIFVGEQSEKSKKAGNEPPTAALNKFLNTSYDGGLDVVLLEEDMNFNQRACILTEVKQSGGYLLIATDIAARGVDLPETSHIYNFDLPKDAVSYLHRAGRTGRKPFSDTKCFVNTIITPEERFVLQRFENELLFHCEQVFC